MFLRSFALVCSLFPATAEPGCISQPAVSAALLQRARKAESEVITPSFRYAAEQMWGLDQSNAAWKQTSDAGTARCRLRFTAASGSSEESQTSLGACISVWKPVQKWRLDLALPAGAKRSSPGKNPALLALPLKLAAAFPAGKWLAVGRAGWMRCPGMEDFAMGDAPYMLNTYCTGSYVAVLDADFRVLDSSRIQVDNASWEDSVMDVRLFSHSSGTIIASFMAYCLLSLTHVILAPLHLEANLGRLSAKLRMGDLKQVEDCAVPGSPKKNLGMLERHNATYILDRIYPTMIGHVSHMEQLAEGSHTMRWRQNGSIETLCVQPVPAPWPLRLEPWQGVVGRGRHRATLHNGPSPVWIPSLQAFLGLGHIRRGVDEVSKGYFLPNHYSHQFFTLSGDYPFHLTGVTAEFCFSSEQDPEDCENIQFASSLLLEGQSLLVGVGIQDCESFVHKFPLQHVLDRLARLSE